MSNIRVTEKFGFVKGASPIDREKCIIHGVKILGRESRNNATYQWDTCSKRANLYENAKIYCHHGTKDQQFPFGKAVNVVAKDDGFWGDVKYNPKLATTEGVLWYIDNDPSAIGMSPDHVVSAKAGPNGSKIYTDIVSVNSVDFVSDPATTKGVFESMNPEGTLTPTSPEGDAGAFERQLAELFATGAKELGPDKFKEVVKHLLNAHAAVGDDETDAESGSKGETARQKGYNAKAEESLKAENAKLKTDLEAYQIKEKHELRKTEARKLCKEASLPDLAVTEHFIETLATKDETAMKADIADRKKVLQVRESRPIAPGSGDAKPGNLDQFVKFIQTGTL